MNFWMAILLLLFVVLGAWSAFGGSMPVRGPKARNLYLPIRYDGSHLAHLITLNLYEATLVTTRFVDKGDVLAMDLSSLPDFPEGKAIRAEVMGSRVLSSHPVSCMVRVRFSRMPSQAREPLSRYVANLARHHGMASGA